MNCPDSKCLGKVRVRHTYHAGTAGSTRDGVCLVCGKRVVAVIVVFEHIGKPGQSAYSRAKQMRQEAEAKKRAQESPF